MLVAITGQPQGGKSTLLENALAGVDRPVYGFLTREMRNPGAEDRHGFQLVGSDGRTARLAGVDVAEGPQVSRYRVDLPSLEDFLAGLRSPRAGELVYLDEVGQMELFSPRFGSLVEEWVDNSELMVCTLSQVYDHPLIDALRVEADHLIEVTPQTRDQAASQLSDLLS